MPAWIIGAATLAIAIASIFVGIGRNAQKIADLEREIQALRLWRHDKANESQVTALLPELIKRMDKLEERLNKRR